MLQLRRELDLPVEPARFHEAARSAGRTLTTTLRRRPFQGRKHPRHSRARFALEEIDLPSASADASESMLVYIGFEAARRDSERRLPVLAPRKGKCRVHRYPIEHDSFNQNTSASLLVITGATDSVVSSRRRCGIAGTALCTARDPAKVEDNRVRKADRALGSSGCN